MTFKDKVQQRIDDNKAKRPKLKDEALELYYDDHQLQFWVKQMSKEEFVADAKKNKWEPPPIYTKRALINRVKRGAN